jgi:O-methyltransferase involved in polyketide biosynthesis
VAVAGVAARKQTLASLNPEAVVVVAVDFLNDGLLDKLQALPLP